MGKKNKRGDQKQAEAAGSKRNRDSATEEVSESVTDACRSKFVFDFVNAVWSSNNCVLSRCGRHEFFCRETVVD